MNEKKYFVSLVLPAYNEEAILVDNIQTLVDYMENLGKYDWEILLVNDGSKDNTEALANQCQERIPQVRVIHHPINLNLGRALQTGFKNAKGEIIVVLDIDLSYSVEHIEVLVDKQIETQADIVNASCYMPGGKVSNVPFTRALMSRFVNRFMRFASQEKYYTFTGMVRAYKADFIKNLNLKTKDYEINPEIMYKAMILRARIEEIPAHLNWQLQNQVGAKRTSSIRVLKGVMSGLMSGFIFRPYIFFIGIGIITMITSLYILAWIFYNTFQIYPDIVMETQFFDDKFTVAIAQVFKERPYSFFIGGFNLVIAIQFLSLGFIALQNKRYFEESFHLSTRILRATNVEKK
ncbi:MAG: glycosyltransferase family 2 protein [Bacteroidales bacterium]|nr:glycosyltransferase family 2 protein [Bacteroidales bacterium]MCF8454708.1 glycosyltransferase family 2 protein [Bacteroidales bacterium]